MSNTGVAVLTDTGDEILLHPKDKKPIGLRLAYLALKNTYAKGVVAAGPTYSSHSIEGDEIKLTFGSVGSGLMTGNEGPLNSFAIAGQDRRLVWTDAEILRNFDYSLSQRRLRTQSSSLRLGP